MRKLMLFALGLLFSLTGLAELPSPSGSPFPSPTNPTSPPPTIAPTSSPTLAPTVSPTILPTATPGCVMSPALCWNLNIEKVGSNCPSQQDLANLPGECDHANLEEDGSCSNLAVSVAPNCTWTTDCEGVSVQCFPAHAGPSFGGETDFGGVGTVTWEEESAILRTIRDEVKTTPENPYDKTTHNCTHYSASFVAKARAKGIPAHVIGLDWTGEARFSWGGAVPFAFTPHGHEFVMVQMTVPFNSPGNPYYWEFYEPQSGDFIHGQFSSALLLTIPASMAGAINAFYYDKDKDFKKNWDWSYRPAYKIMP